MFLHQKPHYYHAKTIKKHPKIAKPRPKTKSKKNLPPFA